MNVSLYIFCLIFLESDSSSGGGGKEGVTGATAAALFPCLIYYPGRTVLIFM